MTLLGCGQCWLGITQVVSFAVVFGGSMLYCLKDFTKRSS